MNKFSLWILVLVLQWWFCLTPLYATHDHYSPGARSAAMASTGVMLPGFWSVHYNQAGLGWVEQPQLGFHHENRYLVSQFALHSLAFAFPARPGTLGISLSYFGYPVYHESRIGLAFGRRFTEQLAAGFQLNYLNTFIADDYGNQGTLSAEAGIILQPLENLFIGSHIYNLTRSSLNTYPDEPIPTIFRLGAAYIIQKSLLVGVEMEKNINHRPVLKAGMEYLLLDRFWIRAGVGGKPVVNSFGLGYALKGISADVAFSYHQIIGFTPHISLMITLG